MSQSQVTWRAPGGRAPDNPTFSGDPVVLVFIGLLALLIAGVDAGLALFGWSMTAVSWSPALFGVLGILFITLEGLERDLSA